MIDAERLVDSLHRATDVLTAPGDPRDNLYRLGMAAGLRIVAAAIEDGEYDPHEPLPTRREP